MEDMDLISRRYDGWSEGEDDREECGFECIFMGLVILIVAFCIIIGGILYLYGKSADKGVC